MTRPVGSKNVGNNEFAIQYEQLVYEEKVDPVRVLFKLLKSRTNSIKIQAAGHLLRYRFPTQKAATLELEAAGQIVMSWEQTVDVDPPALEHLQIPEILGDDGSEPDDQREFVRHPVDDDEIPL